MPPSSRLTHWSTKLESTYFEIGSIDRHRRFIERVLASETVWGLKSNEGWCVAPSSEQKKSVMPFWSDHAYAQQCARNEWVDYKAKAIPVDMFLDEWLPGLAPDGLLAGTNWNAHLIGLELLPLDLKRETEPARAHSASGLGEQ